MAQLVSYEPWDINTVNLYWYDLYATGSLLQTTGFTFQGQSYPDLFTVQANDGVDHRELDFLGSGITQDALGNIVSGTVNAIIELNLTTNQLLWYATGISTSAVSIYNAALTSSNQDEINLIQAALNGSDTIIGSTFNDIISGFSGNDTLTGGGGNDIFLDTKAGHNGDTITDFQIGDAIIFSDATLSSFTFSLSGNVLTYSGGSMTLSGPLQGKLVASAASAGGVQLLMVAPTHLVHNDFNGDGRSDILWRDANGTIFDFLGTTNGGVINNGGNSAVTVGSEWHVAGTGDFNGDGSADILWRNDNGTIFDFLGTSNGGFTNNGNNSFVSVAGTTQVAGVGDFNGDGKSDILWRDASGTIFDFLGTSNGGYINNGANSAVTVSSDWHIGGTGDFNGDGLDDILWRNDNGTIFDFLGTATRGFTNNGNNSFVSAAGTTQIVGIGDFNGDGRSDILWRDANGTIFDFLGTANGGYTNNGANSAVTVSSDWHVVSVGDFNGDGRADILWRNDNGTMFDFLGTASGGFVNNGDNSFVSVAATTHIQDPLF